MVAHTCDPSTQEVEVGVGWERDLKFLANLSYIVRPCLRETEREREKKHQAKLFLIRFYDSVIALNQ
jgi:hypothetical protein